MRHLQLIILLSLTHIALSQQPIQEAFKQDWKILPAYPNINAYQADPFTILNYGDSRVEISPSEQAFLVNFQQKRNGVVLLDDQLKVKWQTQIEGNLFGLYKVKNNLIVVHNGTAEVRNEDYSLIQATVLDPATGKKILTKDILGGKPDHYVDVYTFPDPEKNELIVGFRHTTGLLKQKSKSVVSISRQDYDATARCEILTFDESLQQLKKSVLPIKKASTLYEVEMTLNKNFVLAYRESVGTIGIQVVNGESQIWYKSFPLTTRERFYDLYKIIPSKLFPDVFFFSADFDNTDRDPVLKLFRINYTSQEIKSYERVFTKDYRKDMASKWVSADPDRNSRPIPRYWEYFRLSSIHELQDKIIVVAESVYTETYQMMNTGGLGTGLGLSSRSYNENSDMLLTQFDNSLKILDEKLSGKTYKYASFIGNYAGALLKDNAVYIVTASDERAGVSRPLIMKYNVSKKSFDYQKIAEKGNKKGIRLVHPPSTIWFNKGFAVVWWDGDESMMFSGINTDLQLFPY